MSGIQCNGQGKAIITDNFDHIEIVIPAPRNSGFIAFGSIWLCGWIGGGVFVATTLFNEITSAYEFTDRFLAFWLCGWFVGLLAVGQMFIWMLVGRQVIRAGQGYLTLSKKLLLIQGPKTYDLSQATNFRLGPDYSARLFQMSRNRYQGDFRDLINSGTIYFDYGMKTIKFAQGIDDDEANYIMKLVMGKRLTTERIKQ